jgi:hypothetical protein
MPSPVRPALTWTGIVVGSVGGGEAGLGRIPCGDAVAGTVEPAGVGLPGPAGIVDETAPAHEVDVGAATPGD